MAQPWDMSKRLQSFVANHSILHLETFGENLPVDIHILELNQQNGDDDYIFV